MALYFITGNAGKFAEVQTLIPEVEQLELDLDEIQSLDPQVVVAHKLEQAASLHEGEFIIEDGSVAIECLNGFPGPLIKWFEKSLTPAGLAELVLKYDNHRATASVIIGYHDSRGENHFFTGEIIGRIVAPRGEHGFGWDPIFVPDGHEQTFAEMTPETKNGLSMRRRAIEQFKTAR